MVQKGQLILKAVAFLLGLVFSVSAFAQEPQHRKLRHIRQVTTLGVTAAPFVANAVDFDASNDFMLRGGDLTGNADGQEGTLSVWFRIDGTDGSRIAISTTSSSRVNFRRRSTSNAFQIELENTSGTAILDMETSAALTASSTWRHILASWDLSVPVAHLFLDGVNDEAGGSTETDDTIEYTRSEHSVGATGGGGDKWDGCISEFYANFAEFIDITIASNRDKFRDGSGKPVSLGSDGSLPTGTAPIIYFNGDSTNFQTNQGTGGAYSVTGSLTDCSTSPTD